MSLSDQLRINIYNSDDCILITDILNRFIFFCVQLQKYTLKLTQNLTNLIPCLME